MPTTPQTMQDRRTQSPVLEERASVSPSSRVAIRVDEAVRRRMESCPYRFVFDKVTWQFDAGVLTLHGRVPSFHLKQMLQELLRGCDDIERISNEVDVVSATRLSSERQRRETNAG